MESEFNEDELRMLDEAASIREESIQKVEETYNRSPNMTKQEYDHEVSKNILEASRSLGKSIAVVSKKMKDKAIENGDYMRAKAISRSKNSIGHLIRKAMDEKTRA